MKIVIAPDSFKESMSALAAANAIENGFKKIIPEATYVKVPMADGGEGTVQSLVVTTNGKIISETVTGPAGYPVEAFYGITGDGKTAVIEMAAASGLHLVQYENRNPLTATTKGTGELILAALNLGVKHLIIGLGGSATNDGGAGMAQALGASLLDSNGVPIDFGGGELNKIHSIDTTNLDPRLQQVQVDVACDVDNPLIGDHGASAVFGQQKGATDKMIATLDQNLTHYAQMLQRDLDKDVETIPGSGAAGGLGAGLLAFLEADLKRGIDIVIDAVDLEEHMEHATLVITGEGKIDKQTIYGKTPIGVAKIAKKQHIPVIGLAGSLGEDYQVVHDHGIDALYSIVPSAVSLETALTNAEQFTEQLAENIARTIKVLGL
ncbi:glycerate kinase [Virgibacillus salinus]|uniref:Glycerate kinase n=1 Tax=Virgibacillus salinus TaxID=553311 RepID=A0A1H1FKA5_9BACI|nr:glycerate kinase [Virgibacillus salinus]SDR01169.1 glycerate kinase [Virgibacillus salinus]